jgi:hypothetical protein
VSLIGFPRWDKAIKNGNKSSRQGRSASDTINITYIPFVRDTENFVNASMTIIATPSDTSFSYLCDWQYISRPHSTTIVDTSAEGVALFFMIMDKGVFNHKNFSIVDSNLFRNNNKKAIYVTISDSSNSSGRSQLEQTCVQATITWQDCPYIPLYGHCFGPGGACDNCPLCVNIITWTYCTSGGGGNTGGGTGGGNGGGNGNGSGGGGGSGSGSGSTPPTCGGVPVSRGMVQEGCQPGWVPNPGGGGTNPPEDPCTTADINSGATATSQYAASVKPTALLFSPFDPNTTTQPEEYFIIDNINGTYVPGTIQTLPTTGGQMQGITSNTVMTVHTHSFGGFPGPSAKDFFVMANIGSQFQMSYVEAFNGTKYAMVINSYPQLQAFVAANPGAVDPVTGQFDPSSQIGQEWFTIVSLLGQQGYSEPEAHARATAFIMKHAGVTLVRANAGSDTFKKIGIRQKVVNGVPQVNSSGWPIYENADC